MPVGGGPKFPQNAFRGWCDVSYGKAVPGVAIDAYGLFLYSITVFLCVSLLAPSKTVQLT